jgi:hypothetical protein
MDNSATTSGSLQVRICMDSCSAELCWASRGWRSGANSSFSTCCFL